MGLGDAETRMCRGRLSHCSVTRRGSWSWRRRVLAPVVASARATTARPRVRARVPCGRAGVAVCLGVSVWDVVNVGQMHATRTRTSARVRVRVRAWPAPMAPQAE
jgi:hypothetical protein